MDPVIDLEQATAEITARIPAWTASGLNPGPDHLARRGRTLAAASGD
jgi:hypothetical protein